MTTDRRQFLIQSGAVAAGLAAASILPSAKGSMLGKSAKKLKVLVLGGTGFLGPHVIKRLLENGHEVTMFNRGRSQPRFFQEQFENVEALRGDRTGDLSALEGDRKWDAVIDTSAYYPRVVDLSAGLLKDRVDQYLLVSTTSVYNDRMVIGLDETYQVGTIEDETTEQVNGLTYGPLKALCEKKAEEVMPGRATVVRPGLIVGHGDPTHRYTYWPARLHRAAKLGERAVCPGDGSDYVQYIDVRDLADWMVLALEQNHTGVYNAITPGTTRTARSMIETAAEAAAAKAGSKPELVWVGGDTLVANGIQPWQHMTAWIPSTLEGYVGAGQLSTEKIQKAGMTFRSELDTAKATLEWWLSRPEENRNRYWVRLATVESAAPGEGRRGVFGCPRDLESAAIEAWESRDS